MFIYVLVYIHKRDSVRLQSMVGDLFSVSSESGGEKKRSFHKGEIRTHHVTDIASCFYLVVFSYRADISRVEDDDVWLKCSCLISFFLRRKQL